MDAVLLALAQRLRVGVGLVAGHPAAEAVLLCGCAPDDAQVVAAVLLAIAQRLRVAVGRPAEHLAALAILLCCCALHTSELGRIVVRAETRACVTKTVSLGGIWKWAWAAGPSTEQPGAAEAALLEHASLPKFSGFAQGNEPGPIRQRLPSLHVPSHCPGTISHCPSRTARRRPPAVHFFCFGGGGCGQARAASSRAAFRLFDFFSSRSSSLRCARNALGLPALTRFFRFSR